MAETDGAHHSPLKLLSLGGSQNTASTLSVDGIF
jgi:hypothetical protein